MSCRTLAALVTLGDQPQLQGRGAQQVFDPDDTVLRHKVSLAVLVAYTKEPHLFCVHHCCLAGAARPYS